MVKVYALEAGGYVVSSGGAWVPGIYETEDAARESGSLYSSDIDAWAALHPAED